MGLLEDLSGSISGALSSISDGDSGYIDFGGTSISSSLAIMDFSTLSAYEFQLPESYIAPIKEPIAVITEPIEEILPPVLDTKLDIVAQPDLSGITSQLTTLSGQMISLQQQIEEVEFGISGLERQVSTGFTGIGSQLTTGFSGVMSGLGDLGSQISGGFESVMSGLSNLGSQITEGFDFVMAGLGGLGTQITEGLSGLTELINTGFQSVLGARGDIVKWILIIGGIVIAGVAGFYIVKVLILKKGLTTGLGSFGKNPSIKLPGDIKIKI